jgi:hypothetical protein
VFELLSSPAKLSIRLKDRRHRHRRRRRDGLALAAGGRLRTFARRIVRRQSHVGLVRT